MLSAHRIRPCERIEACLRPIDTVYRLTTSTFLRALVPLWSCLFLYSSSLSLPLFLHDKMHFSLFLSVSHSSLHSIRLYSNICTSRALCFPCHGPSTRWNSAFIPRQLQRHQSSQRSLRFFGTKGEGSTCVSRLLICSVGENSRRRKRKKFQTIDMKKVRAVYEKLYDLIVTVSLIQCHWSHNLFWFQRKYMIVFLLFRIENAAFTTE